MRREASRAAQEPEKAAKKRWTPGPWQIGWDHGEPVNINRAEHPDPQDNWGTQIVVSPRFRYSEDGPNEMDFQLISIVPEMADLLAAIARGETEYAAAARLLFKRIGLEP